MVKCGRCGVEIEDSFKISPNCGNNLNSIGDNSLIKNTKEIACSQCGLNITDDSDFCPNCGNKLNIHQILKCSECGSQINKNDLICSTCGSKINYLKSCSNCGNPLFEDAEFCDECGQRLSSVKNDIANISEKNSDNISDAIVSVFIHIITFFKGLFGENK